jgi:hypothetical protein
MSIRHNQHAGKNIEPKEGQREGLCRNNSGHRCPSLAQQREFSKEGIRNFIEWAKVLKRIHVRLMMEGYNIKDGKIRPSKNKL